MMSPKLSFCLLFIVVLLLSSSTLTLTQVVGPIGFNQLVSLDASGNAVIRLTGFDTTGVPLQYSIQSVPTSGSLYQLSQVYSAYGYNPISGAQITSSQIAGSQGVVVTGSQNRIYYSRPTYDTATNNEWGTFTYTVSNGITTSPPAIVTLVPLTGAIVGSTFLMGNEGWGVSGNKLTGAMATSEPYSRGLLNHYIYGTDDLINVNTFGDVDQSLWYFEAPPSFLGNLGIAYQGSLSYTLSAFSGNFSQLNSMPQKKYNDINMVILECATCHGPVEMGITLAFPFSAWLSLNGLPTPGTPGSTDPTQASFAGIPISIPLIEWGGWLKDPQNSNLPWTTPTTCDMVQVLSRLSRLRILGDYTTWYESVAIDDVLVSNLQGYQPFCAAQYPDASVCYC